MEQFVVSARKYRPATFNSVVGQSSITTTLKNAIRNNHLAQAFLFCGPRGVGKTTCARILAKTINCTNLTADAEGCNQCDSCVSFNEGQSLNIFELDAASNSSVDGMRSLVEQVRFPPQSGKFKIYIIDEVHMLSTQAFNAFLKTLEEPPSYAIFILATTEKHKIIPTILSRCQIFDFNRITVDDIAGHLQWIAGEEKVEAEPEAMHMIAQKADGALRDALSIFDQIVSFAGNHVTYKHVIENLNILDYEYYFRVTDYCVNNDFPSALLLLNDILTNGFDLHHFITGLSGHFRDLLVCKNPQTISLLEVGPGTREKYKAQSQAVDAAILYRYLDIMNRCDVEFKSVQNQRLHCELALLKLCSVGNRESVSMAEVELAVPVKKKSSEPITDSAETTPVQSPVVSPHPPVVNKVTTSTTYSAPSKKPETVSETIPTSQSSARERSLKSGTISISQKLQAAQQGAKPENAADDIPNGFEGKLNPFSEEDAAAAIRSFADTLLREGRKHLAATLSKHPPKILEGFRIEIPVDNTVQASDIQENKTELLGWMKEQLGNHRIEIAPMVVDENKVKEVAYTPAEKFNRMAEKNPELNHLRQQFDLELDF